MTAWSSALREEMLKRFFGPEVAKEMERLHFRRGPTSTKCSCGSLQIRQFPLPALRYHTWMQVRAQAALSPVLGCQRAHQMELAKAESAHALLVSLVRVAATLHCAHPMSRVAKQRRATHFAY